MPKGHFSEKYYPLCTVMSLCSFAGTAHLSVHTASRRLVGVGGGYFQVLLQVGLTSATSGVVCLSATFGPRRVPASRLPISAAAASPPFCVSTPLDQRSVHVALIMRCLPRGGGLFTPFLPFAVYVSSRCADLLTFVKDTECPRGVPSVYMSGGHPIVALASFSIRGCLALTFFRVWSGSVEKHW